MKGVRAMSERISDVLKKFHLEMIDKGIKTLEALQKTQYYEKYGCLLFELCRAVAKVKWKKTENFRIYHVLDNDDLIHDLWLKLLDAYDNVSEYLDDGKDFYYWSYSSATLMNMIYDVNKREEIKEDREQDSTKDIEESGVQHRKRYYREISFDEPISENSETTLLSLYADVSAKTAAPVDDKSYLKFFTDYLISVSGVGGRKVYKDRTFALLGTMMESIDEQYKAPAIKSVYEEYSKDPEAVTKHYNGLLDKVSEHLKLDEQIVDQLRASSVKDILKDAKPDSWKKLSGIYSNWKNRANEAVRSIYSTSRNDISKNITLIRITGNNVTIKRAA